MKIESHTRKAIMGFAVSLLIIAAFGLYFFYFVQQSQNKLTARNFRVLEQVGGNISSKILNFHQNVENIKRLNKQERTCEDVDNYNDPKVEHTDGLANKILSGKAEGVVNKELEFSILKGDSLYENRVYIGQGKIFQVLNAKPHPIKISQSLSSFLNPLFWQTEFEEYILLDDTGAIAYQNGPMGVFKVDLDSLFSIEGGNFAVQASTRKEIEVMGSDYILFAHPFKVPNQGNLILIGLQPASKFRSESRYIPPFMLIFVISLFAILLLSFPFLKLLLISKTERLSRFDLMFCMISLFTVTCLINLLVVDLIQYRKYTNVVIKDNLYQVGQTIEDNFRHELAQVLRQMKHYNTQLAGSPGNKTGLVGEDYPNFDMVAWLGIDVCDRKGQQLYKWAAGPKTTSMVNVSHRQYYSAIVNESAWDWRDSTDQSSFFYLESVYSVNNGKAFAILSAPSQVVVKEDEKIEVVSISAKLKSVYEPLLSHGYKFAIIDHEGEVIFHSDNKRNLQENLLNDLADYRSLRSSMYSHTEEIFNTQYHGNNVMAYILPIENWPIYLVTFYDISYLQSANAEILSFCLLMLCLYGLGVFLLFALIYFGSYSRSKLRFKKNRMSWLIPHPERGIYYERAGIFNLIASLLFMWVCLRVQQVHPINYSILLSLIFIFPLYLISCSYILLTPKLSLTAFGRRNWLLISLVTLGIILINIWIWPNAVTVGYKVLSFTIPYSIAFQVLILLFFMILKLSDPRKIIPIPYTLNYKVALLSFLLAVCTPPVFTFFKLSHDTEMRLYTKLAQLDFAKKLDRDAWSSIADTSHSKATPRNMHNSPHVQMSSTHHTSDERKTLDPVFNEIYSSLRPFFSDKPVDNHKLNDSSIIGKAWRWIDYPDSLVFEYSSPHFRGEAHRLQISSPLYPFDLELGKPWNVFALIMLALFFVGTLYVLINYVFTKLVSLPITQQANPWLLTDSDKSASFLTLSQGQSAGHHVFLIGLPHSGKTSYLREEIFEKNKIQNYKELDLYDLRVEEVSQIMKQVPRKPSVIILDHFELGLTDELMIRKKLELLERILSIGKHRIVVVSTVHAFELIDSESLRLMSGIPAQEARILSERWIRVFENFYKSFFKHSMMGKFGSEELDNLSPHQLIESECEHVHFLKDMSKDLKKYADEHTVENDDIILRIQSLASLYYFSIWRSCTNEEKYLLFDIAQDGIVNTKNIRVISSLINKGLIYSGGTLRLMNRSFRNFILTSVKPEEALALEKEVNKGGTWSIIRLPIIITLLALGVFIFYTQKEVYNNLIAFVAALGAALPMILRMSTVFQKTKKPAE